MSVCDKDRRGKIDDAIYSVIAHVDDMLCAGEFVAVDRLLSAATRRLADMTPETIVSWLCVTLAAKGKLAGRAAFVEAARAVLTAKLPGERIAGVLQGLE